MSQDTISRDDFREATNHSIRAVLNLYLEVRNLFGELSKILQAGQPSFKVLKGRVIPSSRRHEYEIRILRPWEGRIFLPDDSNDEEDGEEEEDEAGDVEESDESSPKKKRTIEIAYGANFLFAKAMIYKPRDMKVEPHLLYGILTNCRIDNPNFSTGKALKLRRPELSKILMPFDEDRTSKLETLKTKASISNPGRGVKPDQRRLIFTLPDPPRKISLYEIDERDKVEKIAEEMKVMWEKGVKA